MGQGNILNDYRDTISIIQNECVCMCVYVKPQEKPHNRKSQAELTDLKKLKSVTNKCYVQTSFRLQFKQTIIKIN